MREWNIIFVFYFIELKKEFFSYLAIHASKFLKETVLHQCTCAVLIDR